MLGLKSFGYNMDIGHVSIMLCALIGVTLLEDQGVGWLVMIFFKAMTPQTLGGPYLGHLLRNWHLKSKTNVGSSILNQLWDKFDFFLIQNERIALMVGGIAHPMLGRLDHLLYELEINDKLGGLKEF